jgi:hypothetical protein
LGKKKEESRRAGRVRVPKKESDRKGESEKILIKKSLKISHGSDYSLFTVKKKNIN